MMPTSAPSIVGVLSFQGSFQPHLDSLERLGVSHLSVNSLEGLSSCTHLIIPGGESTVISQFLEQTGVGKAISDRYHAGTLALFGTCAGAILIGCEPAIVSSTSPAATSAAAMGSSLLSASDASSKSEKPAASTSGRQPKRLNIAPIAVERNAYGRQNASGILSVKGEGPFAGEVLEAPFIRAPKLIPLEPSSSSGAAPSIQTLARTEGGDPVLMQSGRALLCTFHPALTEDVRVHQYFIKSV
jgi:5'-phosphate synthase pdxT subunit